MSDERNNARFAAWLRERHPGRAPAGLVGATMDALEHEAPRRWLRFSGPLAWASAAATVVVVGVVTAVVIGLLPLRPTPVGPSTSHSPSTNSSTTPSAGADYRTAQVIARLPLPHPDAQTAFDERIAVTPEAIWVADASATYLVRIDVATNQVTSVPIDPSSLAAGDAGLWMIGPVGGAPGPDTSDLSRVDLTTGRPTLVASIPPAGSIAVGLGGVWVADGDIRLYDPDTGTLLRSFPNPGLEIDAACGALWSWDAPTPTGGATLMRLDPQTGEVLEEIPVPVMWHPLVQIGDTCWIGASPLIGIQPGHGVVASYILGAIQVAGSTVWQWNTDGQVAQIDVATGNRTGPVWQLPAQDLHADPKGEADWRILSAGGSLWVLGGDQIVRYDIPTSGS